MKIALVQTHLVIGDFTQNSENIKNEIKYAIAQNADMVILPEQVTTVKGAKDLLLVPEFMTKASLLFEEITAMSKDITILMGAISPLHNKLTNSAFLLQNGHARKIASEYSINDEDTKWFAPENLNIEFEFKGEKFAVVLGNDNPAKTSAHWTIRLSSTAFTKGEKRLLASNLINLNHVGLSDELVYNGGSYVIKDDKLTALAENLQAQTIIFDTPTEQEIQEPETCKEEQIFKTLSWAFKEFCAVNRFKKAILGLSGGIDSALTAAIMCDAIGPQNVLGITMPSKYSTEGSWNDSYELAKNLKMECKTEPIKPLFDTFINEVQKQQYSDLAEENLQARLRANILMAYSNRENRILVSTGNKSEASMGYCTLYGDTCGGINLICDLYKQEVYAVSNWINRNDEIIPKNIIEKAPSAELRPGQKDQDSLPDYAVLDDILFRYIEEGQTIEEISLKHDRALVAEIINKLNFMEYKRNQATYSIKLSKKALSDRHYPLVNAFRM